MIDISVNNLKKSFGDFCIFEDINFEIYEGQKVSIIGENGVGKTTLLRILAGIESFDDGNLTLSKFKTLAMLDQIPSYPNRMTVKEVMETAFEEVHLLKKRLQEIEQKMEFHHDDLLLKSYAVYSEDFERLGGYETEFKLAKISNGLGIHATFYDRLYSELSGGEMTKVNLARILLSDADILLLDEPTNHLDIAALEWLEEFIHSFKGTIVTISHDRYFLDRITTRTIELSENSARVWEGNYSYYLYHKEEENIRIEQQYNRGIKEIKRLEYTSRRMHGWGMGNSRLMRRAFALDKRIERLKSDLPAQSKNRAKLKAGLIEADRTGNDVLKIEHLSKSYDSTEVLKDLDAEVKRGETIAIIGNNGTGKTTLLKILMGEENPTEGKIKWGSSIELAYLPQKIKFDDENKTILETTMSELGLTEPSARNRLGVYLFRGDDVFKTINVLSGGEKSRLCLCLLLYKEINTILLDEPTNHLDVYSREWLEDTLGEFEGTMIFVSHDRYFVSKFADRIWEIDNSNLMDFRGNYKEFREYKERLRATQVEDIKAIDIGTKRIQIKDEEKNEKILRQEISELEVLINKAEGEIALLSENMMKHGNDYELLSELNEKYEVFLDEINNLYAKLESVSNELDELSEVTP